MIGKLRKHGFRHWLLLDLAVSFMFGVFAPLEAFFSNESEYWFDLSHLLPVVLAAFALSFLFLSLFSLIVNKTKYRDSLFALGLFLFVFFYVQGNFIPRPYGVLDGAEIDWHGKQFRPLAYASIALALGCMTLWILSIFLERFRKLVVAFGGAICVFLLGIQLATLGTLYIGNEVLGGVSHTLCAVSSEKIFELSRSNNIIMLLLDTFDAKYLNVLLEERDGEVRDVLEDFTFYPDTAGLYPTTRGALPHILTGVVYTNDVPYAEYVRKAYLNNPFCLALAEKNYSAGVYTDPTFVSAEHSVFENVHQFRFEIQNVAAFAKKLFKLVAFNYFPHQLKSRFLVFGSDFLPFRLLRNGIAPYSLEVLDFYEELQKSGISAQVTNSVFRFYHTEGVHPPFSFGKDLVKNSQPVYTRHDVQLGCLALLKAFFGKLRESGVYDVSTIIVLADHGNTLYCQNPLFLVKNRNERHPFQISTVPFSYCDLQNVMLTLLQSQTEITPEFLSKLAERNDRRRFLFYRWGGGWDRRYLPTIEEMRLLGNASLGSAGHMMETGIRYGGENAIRAPHYVLGTTIQFVLETEDEFRPFVVTGVSTPERTHTWTQEREMILQMKIEDVSADLLFELDCSTFNGKQHVIASANGTSIGSETTEGRRMLFFRIPRSCIAKDGSLTLRFALPDAIAAEEVAHNGDVRLLALKLFSMKISNDQNDFHRERGKPLSFAQADGAPALRYCTQGVSHSEQLFTWTEGNKVVMCFPSSGPDWTPTSMTLHYKTFLPDEHVRICCGDIEVANYIAHDEETKTFPVPSASVGATGLVVSIDLPDAVSPRELGNGKDGRRLALRLFSVTLQ